SHAELMRTWIQTTTRGRIALVALTIVIALAGGFAFRQRADAATPEPKTIIGPSRSIVLPTRKDTLPYSDAVLAGNTLYLAGRIGVDPQTGKPPEDLEKEIRLLLDGVKTTLSAADLTMDDLVSVQVFCPDLALY